MSSDNLWGIHHRGGLDFVGDDFIAVGWPDAGDLSDLTEDREQFKERLRATFPGKSEAWVANAAGQLLRFRHVMQPGDLVVYSQKADRTINIGRIGGDYSYRSGGGERYPNRRPVEWLKMGLLRDGFSNGCLYEVGSALSVFTIKEHKDELLARLDGGEEAAQKATSAKALATAREPVSEDEPDVERIAQLTGDFILKTFSKDLKGHDFAEFCGWLFEALGYSVRVSDEGADGGIDIRATEDPLGVGRPLLKVQCKSGAEKSKSSEVQALNGTLADSELGVFIAVGGYTPQAHQAARGMPKMRLIGPEELIELVLSHYPELPDVAKQAIPLRRVWMPDRQVPSD